MMRYTQDTLCKLQKLAEIKGAPSFFQELFDQLSVGFFAALASDGGAQAQLQTAFIASYFYIPLKHYIDGGTPIALTEYQRVTEKTFQTLQ